MGLTLEKASKDVLGSATKVVITKNSTLIVTDGSTRAAVEKRVNQLRRLVEVHAELCHLKISTLHTKKNSHLTSVFASNILHG